MKRCPKCGHTYADPELNFCLNDGELLSHNLSGVQSTYGSEPPPTQFADDSPPTLMMNAPRITNQTNWPNADPPAVWQNQQPAYQSPQSYGIANYAATRDQTIPTVSLILGVFSMIFVCCFGGIWLGLPAAIVGFLGLRNTDRDPDRYSGRGLAIAGMVIGIITFLASIVHLLFAILAR